MKEQDEKMNEFESKMIDTEKDLINVWKKMKKQRIKSW